MKSSYRIPGQDSHQRETCVAGKAMRAGDRVDQNVAGYPAQISSCPRNGERRVKPSLPMRVQMFASNIDKRNGKQESSRGRLRLLSDNILSSRETSPRVKRKPESFPAAIPSDSVDLSESVSPSVLLRRHGVDVDLAGRGLETKKHPESTSGTGGLANLEVAESVPLPVISAGQNLQCSHGSVVENGSFTGGAVATIEDTSGEQDDRQSSVRIITVNIDRCLEQRSVLSADERRSRSVEIRIFMGYERSPLEGMNISLHSPKTAGDSCSFQRSGGTEEDELKKECESLAPRDASIEGQTARRAKNLKTSVLGISSTANEVDSLREGYNKDQSSESPWGIHTADQEANSDNDGSFIRSMHRGLRGASKRSKECPKTSEVCAELKGSKEEDIVIRRSAASSDSGFEEEESKDGGFLRTTHHESRAASKVSNGDTKKRELGIENSGWEMKDIASETGQEGSFPRPIHRGIRGLSRKSQGRSKLLDPCTESVGSEEVSTSVRDTCSAASDFDAQKEAQEQGGPSRMFQESRQVHESDTDSESSEGEQSTSTASDLDSQEEEDDNMYMDAFVRISTCAGGNASLDDNQEAEVHEATVKPLEKSLGDRNDNEHESLEDPLLPLSHKEECIDDAPRSSTRSFFSPARRVLRPLSSMKTKIVRFPSQKSENGSSFLGISSMRSSDTSSSLHSKQSDEEPACPWGAAKKIEPESHTHVESGKEKFLTSPVSTGRLGIYSSGQAMGGTFSRPKRKSLDDGTGDEVKEDDDDDDDDELDNEEGPSREGLDDSMFGYRVSLIYDDFVDYDTKAKSNAKQSPLSKWRQKQAQLGAGKEKYLTSPLSKSRFFAKQKARGLGDDDDGEDDNDDEDDLDNEEGPSREGLDDSTFGHRVSMIHDDFVDYDNKAKRHAKQSAFNKLRENNFRKTFKGTRNRV